MTIQRRLVYVLLAITALGITVLGVGCSHSSPTDTEAGAERQVPATWSDVRESLGHAVHVGKPKVNCNDCHESTTGTDLKPAKVDVCVKCHEPETKRTHAGKDDHATSCLSCHVFGTKPAPTCISCHDKAQGKARAIAVHVNAKNDSPCVTCHVPHREGPSAGARQADCAKCHKDVKATHGKMVVSGDVTKGKGFPDAGAPEPFVADAGADGHGASGTCVDCHAPHTKGVEARAACIGCHSAAPKAARPSGHEACVTCHLPHDLDREGVKPCLSCHADHRGAAGIKQHAQCSTCHVPHDARPSAKAACVRCHAGKVTLGATKVPEHAVCASCHTPHDPKASPASKCTGCHTKVSPSHAPGKADRCVDCHKPHARDATAKGATAVAMPVALACSSCHTAAKSDTAFHVKELACVKCHTPHSFSLAGQGVAVCARCHAPEQQGTAKNQGHAACSKCHGTPHAPTKGAACAQCHAPEASSAPKGHKNCSGCHETHSGARKASATCASCHAMEAASKHATKVQGSCSACHVPHGPKVPATAPVCAACHTSVSLPGLHKVSGHATCATCHTPHGAPNADRANCLTCHAKQKDHEPAATQCNGCHPFRK